MKSVLVSVFSSVLLIACGGGGGGGGGGTSAAVSLAKYAGDWNAGCTVSGHVIMTTAYTAAADGSLSLSQSDKFYAGDNCTGAVVATGTYGQPFATMVGMGSQANATITLPDHSTIVDTVDLVTATSQSVAYQLSGSGVGATSHGADGLTATITYSPSHSVSFTHSDSTVRTLQAALLLRNNQLLLLTPTGGGYTADVYSR